MAHRFGFFDVDNREMDEGGRALAYRPRVQPIVERLERLYALAEAKGYPLVFTTCCSGRMPGPHSMPAAVHVPLDASDTTWREKVRDHRLFYVAKRTCGNPQANLDCRAFDPFHHNANAARLLRDLEVEHWVIFGNGFDLCVGSTATGMLDAGLSLVLLEDVRISGRSGTPASAAATIAALRERGARIMTLEAFLKWESS